VGRQDLLVRPDLKAFQVLQGCREHVANLDSLERLVRKAPLVFQDLSAFQAAQDHPVSFQIPQATLQDVFRATVIARMLCCAPAWSGSHRRSEGGAGVRAAPGGTC